MYGRYNSSSDDLILLLAGFTAVIELIERPIGKYGDILLDTDPCARPRWFSSGPHNF